MCTKSWELPCDGRELPVCGTPPVLWMWQTQLSCYLPVESHRHGHTHTHTHTDVQDTCRGLLLRFSNNSVLIDFIHFCSYVTTPYLLPGPSRHKKIRPARRYIRRQSVVIADCTFYFLPPSPLWELEHTLLLSPAPLSPETKALIECNLFLPAHWVQSRKLTSF